MKINGHNLDGSRVYMVAEAGVNHDGKWETALDLVDIACRAGADAVKFQLFNAKTCKGIFGSILRPLELKREAHEAIAAHCKDKGIHYMVSCFDCEQVAFAKELGCDVIKIGSGELTNHALLSCAGRSGLGVILSTGMSTMEEVWDALLVLDKETKNIVLMHCTSAYPAAAADANLKCITSMRRKFRLPVGYSDHTLGLEAMTSAVSLGAVIIEKHFTYFEGAKGPDHHMSMGPDKLAGYITALRRTEAMLGDGEKRLMECEEPIRKVARGRW